MNIIFERGEFFIREIGKDFIVFRNGGTAATKVASIGKCFGIGRAIAEIDRRIALTA
jgi:hypothetical protein